MSFKYLEWEIVPGVKIPMMEDSTGELWGTNKTVAALLGMSEEGVRKIYFSNKREFDGLSVSNSNAKEFLLQHKAKFGIKRLRADMPLWSSEDVLTFCYRATGDKAIEIRRKFSKLIKEHSKKNYVSIEVFKEMESRWEARFNDLSTMLLRHLPAVEETASLAGKTLSTHRKTKALREMMQ